MRFFAGAFGSSPLTNAGGVIADMFPASQRGLAMSVFAAAPFMGPTVRFSTLKSLFHISYFISLARLSVDSLVKQSVGAGTRA